MPTYRPIQARLSEAALLRNAKALQKTAQDTEFLAVLKADAYGHGALQVALRLQESSDVKILGVASLDEALQLRKGGVSLPIVLMSQSLSPEIVACAKANDLICVLYRNEDIALFLPDSSTPIAASIPTPSKPSLWVKLNTGMNRLGLSLDAITQHADALQKQYSLVLMSHLHSAETNQKSAQAQCQALIDGAKMIQPQGISLCNSEGLALGLHKTIKAQLPTMKQWVRSGYSLYGGQFLDASLNRASVLSPVMRLCAQIVQDRWLEPGESLGYGGSYVAQKRERIGILAAGYADGLPWQANTHFDVSFQGNRLKMLGRISMDLSCVALGHDVDYGAPCVGDWVEFWGQEIPIGEWAEKVNGISYELWLHVHKRVPRVWD